MLHNLSKIKHREIFEGCLVDIPSLDSQITEPFKAIGWEALINPKGPIHENLVREFYASFNFTPFAPELKVHFQLNTTKYSLSTSEFGKLLNLPSSGIRYYNVGTNLTLLPQSFNLPDAWKCLVSKTYGEFCSPHTKPKLTSLDLKIPFIMQYQIIRVNLFGNEFFNETIQAAEFAFLWHLQTRVPCDLTSFVIHRMKGVFHDENRELPYGLLLNNLFYGLNIQILGPSHGPTYRPIDRLSAMYDIDKAMKWCNNTKITREIGYRSHEESSTNGPW
jgi:hypothetical protein